MGTITRTFHNAGQGAFYYEKHPSFNMVYDCGSVGNIKNLRKDIKNVFNKEDVIDILFISHLDRDHINGINELKNNVKEIKRVVMPLLNNIDKLMCMCMMGSGQLKQEGKIVSEPSSVFKDSVIYYVRKKNHSKDDDKIEDPISRLEPNSVIIDSGEEFEYLPNLDNKWTFIPYNYDNKTRSAQFETNFKTKLALKLQNANITDIYNLSGSDLWNFVNKNLSDVKNCYLGVGGNWSNTVFNENSMMLYSGPKPNVAISDYYNYQIQNIFMSQYISNSSGIVNCSWIKKPACVYTGDFDFNCKLSPNTTIADIQLNNIYNKVWDFVGTIQISHHGSDKNYNRQNELCNLKNIYCPVSYGMKNRYGHPMHSVIIDIAKDNYPVSVTQDPVTKFTETFQYN